MWISSPPKYQILTKDIPYFQITQIIGIIPKYKSLFFEKLKCEIYSEKQNEIPANTQNEKNCGSIFIRFQSHYKTSAIKLCR